MFSNSVLAIQILKKYPAITPMIAAKPPMKSISRALLVGEISTINPLTYPKTKRLKKAKNKIGKIANGRGRKKMGRTGIRPPKK